MGFPHFDWKNFPNITASYAAAALILGHTVLPLAGGGIKPYEVREAGAAVSAFINGQNYTPTIEPAFYPRESSGVFPTLSPQPAVFQTANAPADQSAVELVILEAETPELINEINVVPVAQAFEPQVCIGPCTEEEEVTVDAVGEDATEPVATIEPKLITLTPS